MSTMDHEVYRAFRSVGIADDVAMKAAVALNEARLKKEVRKGIKLMNTDDAVYFKANMNVLTWLVAVNFLLLIMILVLAPST